MKNRIVYLDLAKALAIFLVVWGHIIVCHDSEQYADKVAQCIYSFHTAFFMYLSGFFFSFSLKKSPKKLVLEKSRQLLVPYFSWSVVMLLLINIPEGGLPNAISTVKDFVLGGWLKNYWYLKALFLYIVVTYFLVKLTRNEFIGCGLSWILFTVLPNFSFSVIFIPFFIVGHLTKPLIEKSDSWIIIIGLAIVDVILYCFWSPAYNYTALNMSLVPYIIRTGIGCITSMLIILLLKKVFNAYTTNGSRFVSFIAYIGTITLGIYCCHELFYSSVLWGWLQDVIPFNYFVFIIWAVIALLASTLLIRVILKNKWTALLFMGKKLDIK